MEKAIKILLEEQKKLQQKSSSLSKARWELEKIEYNSELTDKLEMEEIDADAEIKRLNDLIKMYQAGCEHDYSNYVGHDSHYDYYECTKCGDRYKH